MSRTLITLSLTAAVTGGFHPRLAGAADPPAVGTVQSVPVVSLAVEVGSTEKDSKRVVYAPPPGWYVRSHRVEVGRRYGPVSYTVSTVPAGLRLAFEESSSSAGKAKGAASGGGHGVRYGGEAAAEWDAANSARQQARASHHSLVVEVTARGAGLWRGGGGIELTVVAEMVYVGAAAR